MSDFKFETKDANTAFFPAEHRVKVSKVVTDSNLTCLHTDKGKFCAPNAQLGESNGIDRMVRGLRGKTDIDVEMGNGPAGGHEEARFVDTNKRPTTVEATLKASRFETIGSDNYRLLAVQKKEDK